MAFKEYVASGVSAAAPAERAAFLEFKWLPFIAELKSEMTAARTRSRPAFHCRSAAATTAFRRLSPPFAVALLPTHIQVPRPALYKDPGAAAVAAAATAAAAAASCWECAAGASRCAHVTHGARDTWHVTRGAVAVVR